MLSQSNSSQKALKAASILLQIAARSSWRGSVGGLPRRLSSSSPFGSVHFGANDADVEDLIEQSLDKGPIRREEGTPIRVLTTRREALALYREILRVTSLFVWRNEQGTPWRDVLRRSARQEFEAARHERDPELVNRLLVVGRDSVHRVAERFVAKRQAVIDNEAAAQAAGLPPSFGNPLNPRSLG